MAATLVKTEEKEVRDWDYFIYTLHVNRVLRGNTAETIRVYEGNDSGRAGFDWVSGREYLLFLFESPDLHELTLDGCGNSGPLNGAGVTLSEIDRVKTQKSGSVIQGLTSGPGLTDVIPRIHIEVQGGTGRLTAVTNENGEFRVSLPAGQYVVRVVEPGRTFIPADFTYENPDKIQLQPGACAQVQFVERRRQP